MTVVACIQWIREELEDDLETLHPSLPETDSLCEFVTDGRALCLLTNKVLRQAEADADDAVGDELPKKLQRSLKQLSKFHALERIQFFIKWCRARAQLEEHQVFTTVQLLDEVNETAVSETIVALRKKTRPHLKSMHLLSPFQLDKDKNKTLTMQATTLVLNNNGTTTNIGSSGANNANRLSSFLNKFPSAPVVTTTNMQSKPPTSHNRVSLTSSVASSNPSPREFEEPVPSDEINTSNSKSRLRIPSIFKGSSNNNNNNNNSLASATSRSSVISNASSTASSNKEECRECRSRSWSSKLSAFSRSHSSSSNLSAPKTPLAGDLDSGDTPSSSPPASPRNRVSIPSAFSTPCSAAPTSMSKLSAFLSSVDTTAPVSNASSQDKKSLELAVEATTQEDAEPAIEDNEMVEEPPAPIAEEISAAKERTSIDVEADNNTMEKPVSSTKLLAFLQAVEPSGATLLKKEMSNEEEEVEEAEEHYAAVEAEEATSAKKEDPVGVDEETAFDEEEVAETESEASDLEVELAATMEKSIDDETAPEMHDEVATDTQETFEVEVEEAFEDETPERHEVEVVVPDAEVASVSPVILQENERLLAENDTLTQQLETAESAVTTKDIELIAVKQELELLKTQLAEEQLRAQDKILAAEKKQELLAADAAETRAELARLQQTNSVLSSAVNEAKAAKAQAEELVTQHKSLMADLMNLREEVQTLEQSVQLARDSEEAARYAAQVAFAARDSADDVNQQLKNQLCELEK
ncbi:unnamed protein product [Peronospora belbahrii]|uniref:Calponin-homology (CH) domain-containing protein n=1 Tax=Peronospora belbahrii TaxID=622444 RepID=A0AAU9LBI3_9STRA|nr:unnamed protein product [Peronospora belbahrii]CAH0522363.1 unnamed protein product [Peronospora belbahrii]